MSLPCCVEGCTQKAQWMLVWYNSPRVGETLEIAAAKYVCDSSWHIVPQRRGGYPHDIFNVETGREYIGLIEDHAREFKRLS